MLYVCQNKVKFGVDYQSTYTVDVDILESRI